MIPGWEDYTEEIKKEEYEKYLRPIALSFEKRIGKENAIKGAVVCRKMQEYGRGLKLTKLAKLIGFIRKHGIVKNLVSNQKGYWVATDIEECIMHIRSLQSRINEIERVRKAMEEQMVEKFGEPDFSQMPEYYKSDFHQYVEDYYDGDYDAYNEEEGHE